MTASWSRQLSLLVYILIFSAACSDSPETESSDADVSHDASDGDRIDADAAGDSGDGDDADVSRDADPDADATELEAEAGPDQYVSDLTGDGAEVIALDGSRSSGAIDTYEWRVDGELLASTATASVSFAIGTHLVTLTVFDAAGTVASDTLTVMVLEDSADRPQRFNLPEEPSDDRFPLPPDRVWPALGEGDICLWSQDRFAAFTITIDDNEAQDHPWWREQLAARDMTATWFVITGEVDSGHPKYGTWAGWTELRDEGYGLGSHAVNSGDPDGEGWDEARFRSEYAGSIEDLETNIPGLRALTIAHPWGESHRAACADHFIAGRGTPAMPNRAHRIDYMNISSTSGGISLDLINSVLGEPSGVDWWNRDFYVRGWASVHYHFMAEDRRADAEAALDLLHSYAGEIWIGRFPDVALYAAERDTATLTMVVSDEERVVFTLSDEMDDSIYTFPLTVKLGVPLSWTDLTCAQHGEPCAARIVDNAGARFALVEAIPDRGPVVIEP